MCLLLRLRRHEREGGARALGSQFTELKRSRHFYNHPFGPRCLLQPRCPIRLWLSRTEGEALGALGRAYWERSLTPTRPARLLPEVHKQPRGPWASALV